MTNNDKDRENACLHVALILLVIWLLLVFTGNCDAKAAIKFEWSGTRAEYARQIDSFLVDYFAKTNGKKLKIAREIVPVVLDICEKEQINPAIVASIITYESTWAVGARGKLGELGLMQVNNQIVGDTAAEQIAAGVAMLKRAHERCNDITGTIALYATGKSCKPYRGAALRVRTAERIEGY